MENLKGRDHSEDAGVDETIILEFISRLEVVDWIHLAQHKDQWRALLNMTSIKGGEFLH
jgi:hypothetical protein